MEMYLHAAVGPSVSNAVLHVTTHGSPGARRCFLQPSIDRSKNFELTRTDTLGYLSIILRAILEGGKPGAHASIDAKCDLKIVAFRPTLSFLLHTLQATGPLISAHVKTDDGARDSSPIICPTNSKNQSSPHSSNSPLTFTPSPPPSPQKPATAY